MKEIGDQNNMNELKPIYKIEKTVMPGKVDGSEMYVKIKFENKRLSITGTYAGGGGQCVDTLRELAEKLNKENSFRPFWTEKTIKKLADIWDSWHLNDINPDCEHQRALGWGKNKIELKTFKLSSKTLQERRNIDNAIGRDVKKLGRAQISTKQQELINLAYTATERQIKKKHMKFYELQSTETKKDGWVSKKEHPDGKLSRPCPECGHKYGTEWKHETIPLTVLHWLEKLPPFQLDGKNEYEHQANTFLKDTETEIKVEYVKTERHFDDDQYPRDIYNITFTRGERSFVVNFGQSYTCSGRFWIDGCFEKGIHNGEGKDHRRPSMSDYVRNENFEIPSAYSVLACLQKYEIESLESFCSEFGYEPDSRKSEKLYNAVKEEFQNVERMWSPDEIEKLRAIQ